ncbi:hypothetical protein N7499_007663 [Penicillium canescens]|nr:hypothetical protein N7499_007663 [Penicillium canescens]
MPINQTSNQIKFTNVSVVRLKRVGKKRFELACYKNKLLEYRSGAEKTSIICPPSPPPSSSPSPKHKLPVRELAKSFGAGTPREEILKKSPAKGEVQVGERERKDILERVEKEVLDIVSGRPSRPHYNAPSGQQGQQAGEANGNSEEKAAQPKKPMWTGVSSNRSAKSQALDAMKALIAWQPIPVMRARMRLRVTCPVSLLKQSVKAAPGATPAKEKEAPSGGSKNRRETRDRRRESVVMTRISRLGLMLRLRLKPPAFKDKIMAFIESIESQEVIGGDEWRLWVSPSLVHSRD